MVTLLGSDVFKLLFPEDGAQQTSKRTRRKPKQIVVIDAAVGLKK